MSSKVSPFRFVWRLAAPGAAALVVYFGWSVTALASDKSDISDADKKALAGYHLTAAKLDSFDAVNKKIEAAMSGDPVLKKELSSGILNVGSTLDDALGQFDSRAPHLAAMIKAAGMSDRDYVLSLFSVMFASTGQMMKQYAPKDPLPAYIPADNVALAEKDPAHFQNVMQNMDHLTAKARKSGGGETATDD